MIESIRLEDDKNFIERMEFSDLFDYYRGLLSDSNREIFESYMINDLSLGEVADNLGISRQGVRDAVNRCKRQLRKYEEQLMLMKKSKQLQEYAQELKECTARLLQDGENNDDIRQLADMADKLSGLL